MKENKTNQLNDNKIELILKLVAVKMKEENLNARQLAIKLDVNYPNLTRVINRKLINNRIISKLNAWVNEQ